MNSAEIAYVEALVADLKREMESQPKAKALLRPLPDVSLNKLQLARSDRIIAMRRPDLRKELLAHDAAQSRPEMAVPV